MNKLTIWNSFFLEAFDSVRLISVTFETDWVVSISPVAQGLAEIQ